MERNETIIGLEAQEIVIPPEMHVKVPKIDYRIHVYIFHLIIANYNCISKFDQCSSLSGYIP